MFKALLSKLFPPNSSLTKLAQALKTSKIALSTYLQPVPKGAYSTIEIPKKRGGVRTLEIPSEELRQLQRIVYARLLKHRPVHPNAHGFAAGRSIVTNAAPHVQKPLIITFDLANFFPTITAKQVEKSWRITNILKKYHGTYTRYADDMILSFTADTRSAHHALMRVLTIINAEKFEPCTTALKLSTPSNQIKQCSTATYHIGNRLPRRSIIQKQPRQRPIITNFSCINQHLDL